MDLDWSDLYGRETYTTRRTNLLRHTHRTKPSYNRTDSTYVEPRTGTRERALYTTNAVQYAGVNGSYEYRASSPYYRAVRVVTNQTPCISRIIYASGVWARRDYTDWINHIPGMYYADLNVPMDMGFDPNLKNFAIVKCTSKLSSNATQYLTTLAEARKTINHLADAVYKASKFIYLIRRFKFTAAYRSLVGKKVRNVRNWADGWLEYNYAWKSLANEIHGYIEAFKSIDPHGLILKAVANPRDMRTFNSSGLSHGVGEYSLIENSEYTYGYRAVILASVDDEFMRNLQRFSLDAPELTLWEIVPFSFVIDWLIPVGTFLEALNASSKLNFVTASCTFHCEGTTQGSFRRIGTETMSRGTYTVRHRVTRRERYTDWPRLKPYWKSPFSTSHVTSALALFHASTRRRHR